MELAKKHAEKIRFGIVGLANTAIDFGILFILAQGFLVPDLIANIISTSVALTFSFFINRSFTFKSSSKLKAKQIILYIAITLFGLWVLQNIVILGITSIVGPLHLPAWFVLFVAKGFATVVSLIWNYVLYSRLVFRKTT